MTTGFRNILAWLLGWRAGAAPWGAKRLYHVAAATVFVAGAVAGEEFCTGATAGQIG